MPSRRLLSSIRHPVLAPGLRVVSRGPDELQVGLSPTDAVVLPRSPAVTEALDGLSTARMPTKDEPLGVVGELLGHGLVVDANDLVPTGTAAPGDLASAARFDPAAFPDVLDHRRATRVRVEVFGATALPDPRDLLDAAGVGPAGRDRPAAVLLLGVGEPERERLDPLVREGIAHLVVRLTDGVATVGPFVAPGRTACLRCLDAHHTDVDPRWPLLVRQYADRTADRRGDGTPEPVDSALATLAVAWAVRDLVTWIDGGRPATWSATVALRPQLAALEALTWLRHPECGCSWGETNDVAPWATMES